MDNSARDPDGEIARKLKLSRRTVTAVINAWEAYVAERPRSPQEIEAAMRLMAKLKFIGSVQHGPSA